MAGLRGGLELVVSAHGRTLRESLSAEGRQVRETRVASRGLPTPRSTRSSRLDSVYHSVRVDWVRA